MKCYFRYKDESVRHKRYTKSYGVIRNEIEENEKQTVIYTFDKNSQR